VIFQSMFICIAFTATALIAIFWPYRDGSFVISG
jgi:hypothetical protein